MDSTRTRQALVVRGGWDGHSPVEATELFIPFLKEQGFAIEVHDEPDVYADAEKLAATDLVVQCYTQGAATDEQVLGLSAAVANGTGLAGWHGGVCDSFRGSPDYLHLTGGQWAAHPGGFVEHDVEILPEKADHELVAGLAPRWSLNTEQYWVLTDALNEVLATTTFRPTDGTRVARGGHLPGCLDPSVGSGPGLRVDHRAQAGGPRPPRRPHADRAGPAVGESLRRIILDTDLAMGAPGSDIDDGFALALALADPGLQVELVTTVGGNSDVETSTRLTRELLEVLGRSDVTVVQGAPVDGDAADEIGRRVLAEPGELSLVCIGPLTNVARALADPVVAAAVREVVAMGGVYLEQTNVAAMPGEYNFWCDPEAAQVVLESGVPLRLVGLDVTRRVRLTRADARRPGLGR